LISLRGNPFQRKHNDGADPKHEQLRLEAPRG
jgi:hypothetical protein